MIIPLAAFGNLMGMDGIVILIVLLLLFGAKKLPELAKGLGQSLNEFKKARDDFAHELHAEQKDPQARAVADGRQAYVPPAPAAVPTQTLPYIATQSQPVAAVIQSPEELKKQVELLQGQLRAMQEQQANPTNVS